MPFAERALAGKGLLETLGAGAGIGAYLGSEYPAVRETIAGIDNYFNPPRTNYQEYPPDPRIAGWRPRTSNELPAVERARLTADAGSDPLGGPRGDTFAQHFAAAIPGPSVADAYRMAGLADMANYYEPTPREERLMWANAARLADAYQRQKEPQLQLVRGQSLAGFKPPTAQQIASELGTMETVRDLTVPQTPLDYATMALLPAKGISTAAKVAGLVGGGLLQSDEAEAGGKGGSRKPRITSVENWVGPGGKEHRRVVVIAPASLSGLAAQDRYGEE